MPRRTPEEAEQTRLNLLNTALRMYAQQGLHQVSLKQIAAQAGVTHGAVYWHFRNRDHLLESLYFHHEMPFEQQFVEQQQAIRQDPVQALADYLRGVLRAVLSRPALRLTYRLFWLQPDQAELADVYARLQADQALCLSHLLAFLKQARKKKLLKKKFSTQPFAESLAAVLHALLREAVQPALFSPNAAEVPEPSPRHEVTAEEHSSDVLDYELPEAIEHLIQALIRGLAAG